MGEAIISRRGGGGIKAKIIKVSTGTSAPSSSELHEVWIDTEVANNIYFQNDEPESLIENDIWIKIGLEYIQPKLFKKGSINVLSRLTSHDMFYTEIPTI